VILAKQEERKCGCGRTVSGSNVLCTLCQKAVKKTIKTEKNKRNN